MLMLKASYDSERAKKTIRTKVFNTEKELLEDFFEYCKIPERAQNSWRGLCDYMFDEDDQDGTDLEDRGVSIDLSNGLWLNITFV